MKKENLYIGKLMYIGSADDEGIVVAEPCPIVEINDEYFVLHLKGLTDELFAKVFINTYDGYCYHWNEYKELESRVSEIENNVKLSLIKSQLNNQMK